MAPDRKFQHRIPIEIPPGSVASPLVQTLEGREGGSSEPPFSFACLPVFGWFHSAGRLNIEIPEI